MVNNVPMDNVQLNFTVEDWISSDSAEVTVTINATTNGEAGGNLKDEIRDSLKDLVDVEWRFTNVHRSVSRSGMEEWLITAQARIGENDMNNINAQAKKLGRSGLKIRVQYVDYSPTKEQYEELYSQLRESIYEMVNGELTRLNSELSDREWRIAAVNFNHSGATHQQHRGQPMVMMAASANVASMETVGAGYDGDDLEEDGSGEGFSGFKVSEKVEMNANVVIQSTVKGFDKLEA